MIETPVRSLWYMMMKSYCRTFHITRPQSVLWISRNSWVAQWTTHVVKNWVAQILYWLPDLFWLFFKTFFKLKFACFPFNYVPTYRELGHPSGDFGGSCWIARPLNGSHLVTATAWPQHCLNADNPSYNSDQHDGSDMKSTDSDSDRIYSAWQGTYSKISNIRHTDLQSSNASRLGLQFFFVQYIEARC